MFKVCVNGVVTANIGRIMQLLIFFMNRKLGYVVAAMLSRAQLWTISRTYSIFTAGM